MQQVSSDFSWRLMQWRHRSMAGAEECDRLAALSWAHCRGAAWSPWLEKSTEFKHATKPLPMKDQTADRIAQGLNHSTVCIFAG
ncbi:hypothetical protein [Xanthomonas campestris]|jgi:hypothetical protein|uniref:hypothetical protein n=1 Tax=Xanthomonas campestris TaxID=339 RepID=UPI0035567293